MNQTANLVTALQNLTEGLLWMSEIDAPLEIIHWQRVGENLTADQVLQQTGHSVNSAIATEDFDEFFSDVLQDKKWFGEEEQATTARYRKLVAFLKQHLQHLTVYRVGEVEVDLYIVGTVTDEEWVGLSTKASET